MDRLVRADSWLILFDQRANLPPIEDRTLQVADGSP